VLKLVKWAFDLGVRQERVRISAHLQNVARQAGFAESEMYDIFRDEKTSQRKKNTLELEMAVERKIMDTVDKIMRPQNSDYFGYSIMFPEDKHKEQI